MKQILIVVDMQKDFIDGSLGTPEAVAILPKVAEKMRSFEGEIIFTRDTHETDYMKSLEGKNLPVPHCIRDTDGWQIAPELTVIRNGVTLDKLTFGSVELGQMLVAANAVEPIEKITLVGLCTDICVISNAMLLKAALPEAEIVVDGALCAGVTPESHERALLSMKMCQIAVV